MINFNNKWMKIAIIEAKKYSKSDEIPISAVLVNLKTNELISKSCNKVFSKSDPTAHAEIEVIRKASKLLKTNFLKNTAIYVTLEPCIMCAAAISEAQISRVYFGAYDNKNGGIENGPRLYNNKNYFKPEVYGGIMEEDCSLIIKNFFKNLRNK